jgi:hypothetical protein
MTTKTDISRWFDQGVRQGAAYMAVICDQFDWDDYPSYFNTDSDVESKVRDPGSMQKVMEVYDLRKSKTEQLEAHRVWNMPGKTP